MYRSAVEASPAKQVFRTVGGILVLVRVSALILHPSMNSHRRPDQDKMMDDEDSVQLSKYCFDACEALKTVIQGKNADDINEPVREALEDLGRYVD